MTCQTLHCSSSCQESLQERAARMMRTRAEHAILHIVLIFLVGREKVIFDIRKTCLPSDQKQKRMRQHFWLHHSLVADGNLSPCARPSKAVVTWDLVWIFSSWPTSKQSMPLSIASFHAQNTLALWFSIGFISFICLGATPCIDNT